MELEGQSLKICLHLLDMESFETLGLLSYKTIKKLKSYEKRIKNPFSNTTISEAIFSTPSLDTTDEKGRF